jgi:hypothetical protein
LVLPFLLAIHDACVELKGFILQIGGDQGLNLGRIGVDGGGMNSKSLSIARLAMLLLSSSELLYNASSFSSII